MHPIWREYFTFDIATGQAPLSVYLANKDTYGTNDILGRCEISLQPLRDQMKHDQWFELEKASDPSQFGKSTRISSF
jgi:hypothetical protein